MKENVDLAFKIVSIITAIMILVSIVFFVLSFLRPKAYLKVNKDNEEYILKLIAEIEKNNIDVDKKIKRIGYMQGLGDWYLYIEYADGSNYETLLGDGNGRNLRMYLGENAKSGGSYAIYTFEASVLIEVVYFIYKLLNKMNDKTNKKIEKDLKEDVWNE